MKAVVYQGPFKVAVEDVENPRIEHPNDVIVRITSSAICGSDLHMYEGRTAAEPGIVFGHENLGIVQEVGGAVTSIRQGDRVVMPFNVACGFCRNCTAGYTGFCLTVNPGFAGGAYGYVAKQVNGAYQLTCRANAWFDGTSYRVRFPVRCIGGPDGLRFTAYAQLYHDSGTGIIGGDYAPGWGEFSDRLNLK